MTRDGAAIRQAYVGAAAATLLVALVARFDASPAAPAPAVQSGPPAGAWISEFAANLADALPAEAPRNVILALAAACFVGLMLAWLFRRLLYNNWPPLEAVALIAGVAGNAVLVGAITVDRTAVPVMLAAAALIPAIRRMEAVGDVQAEMGFGLVLAILVLASPALSLLVLPLAAAGALSDPDARRDGRALPAMLLVALMPSIIVIAGLVGILGSATFDTFAAIYAPLAHPHWPAAGTLGAIGAVVAFAILPFAFAPLAHCFTDDRRRQPLSALAVLALPLYLAAAAAFFDWPSAPATAGAALLAAFTSWLAVVRLSPVLRAASLGFVLLAAALSWIGPLAAIDGSGPALRGTQSPP